MGSPARILYVITDLEVGGVPLHLHRLARAIRDRGFTPEVVSLAPAGPVADRLRQDGIEVESCEGQGSWDLRVVARLTRVLKDGAPDIVHAVLFHANLAARLAARRAGIRPERVVCEIQTAEVERRWHLWVDRWTHRGCRFTIGNSPSVIDHLAARAGIPRTRLRLVRGGIDPGPLRQASPIDLAEIGVGVGHPIVFWAGRLDPVKGLAILLDAFDTIRRQTGAHLLLAGSGPMHAALVERISDLAMTDCVHLLGTRGDIPRLLQTADVFVFPSRTEGLPNALLEAMAVPCPIVTTDVPGCRDLIEHEKTGLVVPYGDPATLAASIKRLLNEPELARRLARRASEAVERDWHSNRMFEAYASVYAEILNT